jgi:hypothetical protein
MSGFMRDSKLGLRMLVKHPGLTLVGGLAMAFAIWAGAISFEFFMQVVRPQLPLDGGDRIVAIEMLDAATGNEESRTLHDFLVWHEELESLEHLGASRSFTSNLIIGSGRGEPVLAAQISAFRHDADDGMDVIAEMNLFPDDVRVRVEPPPPDQKGVSIHVAIVEHRLGDERMEEAFASELLRRWTKAWHRPMLQRLPKRSDCAKRVDCSDAQKDRAQIGAGPAEALDAEHERIDVEQKQEIRPCGQRADELVARILDYDGVLDYRRLDLGSTTPVAQNMGIRSSSFPPSSRQPV